MIRPKFADILSDSPDACMVLTQMSRVFRYKAASTVQTGCGQLLSSSTHTVSGRCGDDCAESICSADKQRGEIYVTQAVELFACHGLPGIATEKSMEHSSSGLCCPLTLSCLRLGFSGRTCYQHV
jgi:hypothetical protein